MARLTAMNRAWNLRPIRARSPLHPCQYAGEVVGRRCSKQASRTRALSTSRALAGTKRLGHTGEMMTPEPATYPGYRFPAEIISYAVWLYHVFGLSLREVELILAERGHHRQPREHTSVVPQVRCRLRP